MRSLLPVLLAALAASTTAQAADVLQLQGTLEGKDHQRYLALPFDVPAGTGRVAVTLQHDGAQDRTVIDLGLLDANGFRGWSGGSRSSINVSRYDASGGYLPGAIPAGQWQVLLGIPNIRAKVKTPYKVEVTLWSEAEVDAGNDRNDPVLRDSAGWYRGDLHMHSTHSDGSCSSQQGRKVPCPLFLSLQAAVRQGLDFVALTEHNTVSHLEEVARHQPWFDQLLLIPGMEVTTFQGHANVFGVNGPLPFRLGEQVPDWSSLLGQLKRSDAVFSINHPALPSGEDCMGCGWTPATPVDMAAVQAVEVVNGSQADGPRAGVGFWEKQLQQGRRMTAIGGSDSHNPGAANGPSPIGLPATLVHAPALSRNAILAALKQGRVVVDVRNVAGSRLDLWLQSDAGQRAEMGQQLALPAGQWATLHAELDYPRPVRIELIVDGQRHPSSVETGANGVQQASLRWRSDGKRHWLRVDARDADGSLLLLGNPVYVNWPR
ncbi:MAG: CehA/McbA family metallohydrolase [Stenotrophomonas sp.]